MKLFPPRMKIEANEGFTDKNDVLKRKEFGESLARLASIYEDAYVIALDAPWGEGKTTFVKQWQGLLASEDWEIDSIYFDAFAHDLQKDPLETLADELYAFIDEKASQTSDGFWNEHKPGFLEGAFGWVANKASAFLKVGGAACGAAFAASTVGGGPEVEALTAGSSASGEELGNLVEDYFESRQARQRGIEAFNDTLRTIGDNLIEKTNKPLIFIIDELDRCRPDFALDLLEQVKHVFSVPGIVFLLVYNSRQMQEHIRCRYGRDVDAVIYLNKFIDIVTHLPKREGPSDHFARNDLFRFITGLNDVMGLKLSPRTNQILYVIARSNGMSLREVERLLSCISLVKGSVKRDLADNDFMIIGISLVNIFDHELLRELRIGEKSWTRFKNILAIEPNDLEEDKYKPFTRFYRFWSNLLDPEIPDAERETVVSHHFWDNPTGLDYYSSVFFKFLGNEGVEQ